MRISNLFRAACHARKWHDLKRERPRGEPPHTHTHRPPTPLPLLLQSLVLFVLSPCIFEIYSPLQNNTCRQQGRRVGGRGSWGVQIFTLCRQYYVCHFSCLASKERLLSFFEGRRFESRKGMWRVFLLLVFFFFLRAELLFDEMQLHFKV